mmetsp:Transcript_109266/g.296295  ORF Transcript_109266/g.296295 Transcript_109266/m.296295 type:complete len:123 (-) Transcript_109266:992-1360(-)
MVRLCAIGTMVLLASSKQQRSPPSLKVSYQDQQHSTVRLRMHVQLHLQRVVCLSVPFEVPAVLPLRKRSACILWRWPQTMCQRLLEKMLFSGKEIAVHCANHISIFWRHRARQHLLWCYLWQ